MRLQQLARFGAAVAAGFKTYEQDGRLLYPALSGRGTDSGVPTLAEESAAVVKEATSRRKRQRRSLDLARAKYTTEHFVGDLDVFHARTPVSGARHPFWHFEGHQLQKYQVPVCCAVLFLAGVLCSAGGIGGGGIYVTVLMVAGTMKVADAVPLSKSVVFFGSIASLILNMRKSMSSEGSGPAKALIDYNICRLVVPSALLGTFLGVFLNRHLPSWLILLVLVAVLLFISASVAHKTLQQYLEESAAAAAKPAPAPVAGSADVRADEERPKPGPQVPLSTTEVALPVKAVAAGSKEGRPLSVPGASLTDANAGTAPPTPMRSVLSRTDIAMSLFMLVVVIVFGMLRFHAGECMRAEPNLREEVCNHPAYFWLGHGTLEGWMSSAGGARFVRGFSFLFPLLVCAAVLTYYTSLLITREGWRLMEALQYSLMAICTGCLAGLIGIGGGLIFSPFFLIMGLDPAVAVASSSTCVIFTSASTTMQYLLTDRIIVSLTLVYGAVNLLASSVGTTLVHTLQDRFSARKSYISGIVLLGVAVSTALSVVKLVSKLRETFGSGHVAHHTAEH